MRLRFTIRDLLWLAALVAVCVAWRLDRNQLADGQNRQVVKTVQLEKELDAALHSNNWEKLRHAIPDEPVRAPNPRLPIPARDLRFEPRTR
jgi:hypothetical protein